MRKSGWLDARLYDDVFLLSHILCEMCDDLTEIEKEKLKTKFLKKALEQEPKTDVLDKIRAEMQFYSNSFVLAGRNDLASAVSYCIEIIDKYGGEG